MYVEREIDHYGLYEGVEDVLKSLNAELVISLDPEKVSECDGILVPGGLPDVDPALYGEENQGSMNLDRELDDLQLAVIDAAVKAKKPMLTICRGMHTYVPNENKLHDTLIVKGTPFAMLYGENGIVNSAHHQAVRKPGKGFRITQVWLSGKLNKDEREEWIRKIENEESLEVECKRTCIIEGMMHRELPIIAVQWHPELMHRDPIHGTLDQDRIFMYFISLLH